MWCNAVWQLSIEPEYAWVRELKFLLYSSALLNWGNFPLPGNIWQYLETFLFVPLGMGGGGEERYWHLAGRGQGRR